MVLIDKPAQKLTEKDKEAKCFLCHQLSITAAPSGDNIDPHYRVFFFTATPPESSKYNKLASLEATLVRNSAHPLTD